MPPSWTAKRYIRPEAVQRREIGIEVGKDADFLIFDERDSAITCRGTCILAERKLIKHQILADYDALW